MYRKLPVSRGNCLTFVAIALAYTLACSGNRPPAGTPERPAFDAHQLLQDIIALSQTAINLNAQQPPLHLSDADTAAVRDFALSASPALQAYGQGASTLTVVVQGFQTLVSKLSADAKVNSTLAKVLAVVQAGVNAIPPPGGSSE